MVFAIKNQQLLAVEEWGPFPWEGNGDGCASIWSEGTESIVIFLL